MDHRAPPPTLAPHDLPDTAVAGVALPDGRRLIVREAHADDADRLHALYRRLSIADLSMRFFTAAAPSVTFLKRWVTVSERGGLLLLALVEGGVEGEEPDLVAEAGYSMQADGDGELGITVDPAWRGWLGPWLLDVLLREAGARGVPNLQAVVRLGNRRMLALLRHRRPAIVEQDPPDEIRLAVGTSGATSTWPQRPSGERPPRILVEAAHGRWVAEDAARAAGFDVRTCRGPGSTGSCPMLAGERCDLADGADAVVVLLRPDSDDTARITAAHRERGTLEVIVPGIGCAGEDPDATTAEVVAALEQVVGAR